MDREQTHALAKALIESAGSHFLSIEFIKKDGTVRRMLAHPTAIENRCVGDAASESAKQKNATAKRNHPEMFRIVDVEACKAGEPVAIRTINLDTLLSITVNGTRHDFEPVAFQ